ncbi:MAG: DNA helicase related protein, partial [uncultured Sulfurovum sp.]
MNGKNVVIEGPPGTGKSQTISNMVAALIADGKSVLFVSEKLAALEVVYQRLSDVGLGDFCLELHSHKTQKLKVLESIKKRIDGEYQIPSELEIVKYQIENKKNQLRDYLDVLHCEYGEISKKIFEIFWLV